MGRNAKRSVLGTLALVAGILVVFFVVRSVWPSHSDKAAAAASAIPTLFRQATFSGPGNAHSYVWRNMKCVSIDPVAPGVGDSFQCQALLQGTEPSFGQAVYHMKLGLMSDGRYEAFDISKTQVKAIPYEIPQADEAQVCVPGSAAMPVPPLLRSKFHPKAVENTC